MSFDNISSLSQRQLVSFGISSLSKYWPNDSESVANLVIKNTIPSEIIIPVKLESIALPQWAQCFGIEGCILVPAEVAVTSKDWKEINWWYVVYWYLNCLAERKHEQEHGPIHSFSFKLKGWDSRMWGHAWVNRIAMFLKCWLERENKNIKCHALVENLPTEIYLTHDLDAIKKTFAIRFKQTIFHGFNAVREILKGNVKASIVKLATAILFFFRREDYQNFDKLKINKKNSLITKQIVNVYAGKTGWKRTFKQMLFDPAYDISAGDTVDELRNLIKHDIEIGLHQSFDAWHEGDLLSSESEVVRKSLNQSITTCRQHWLRFSFDKTWQAQSVNGFLEDTTLGFNDRPGFRNGAAIGFNPIQNGDFNRLLPIESIPMVLMDSHLYDYQVLDDDGREKELSKWIDELEFVGGKASIIWHPHTLGRDYGWGSGFDALIKRLCRPLNKGGV